MSSNWQISGDEERCERDTRQKSTSSTRSIITSISSIYYAARFSSATPIEGCVSLSWIVQRRWKVSMEWPESIWLRIIMSCDKPEKVMLLKAKLLTVDVFVVSIQGLVKVFGEDFGSHGTW
jgi:hypothetical protein